MCFHEKSMYSLLQLKTNTIKLSVLTSLKSLLHLVVSRRNQSKMVKNLEIYVKKLKHTSSTPSPVSTDTQSAPLGPHSTYDSTESLSKELLLEGCGDKRSAFETTSNQGRSEYLPLISLYILYCKKWVAESEIS